ncbi:hypothetical protein FU552_08840, partial [Campylobacter jejuni]|nr:hypothetical protein [Campylobacter jejuni]ECQ0828275.1 hypothetical protein [Campylobacter jejuni]
MLKVCLMCKNITIEGNSGCSLEIHNNKIFKYTQDIKYVERLKLQCAKQNFFFDLLISDVHIKIPKVLNEYVYSESGYGFSMQYCRANNFITFFENFDMRNILSKIEILLEFIDKNVNTCQMIYIDKKIVKNKLESLYQIFFNSDKLRQYAFHITDILHNQLYLFDKYQFPIGYCHGDLTFSNILFQNQHIILIDFLDNFIETPLQDIVKLRQDTRHKWSLKMARANYDEIKIKIILN